VTPKMDAALMNVSTYERIYGKVKGVIDFERKHVILLEGIHWEFVNKLMKVPEEFIEFKGAYYYQPMIKMLGLIKPLLVESGVGMGWRIFFLRRGKVRCFSDSFKEIIIELKSIWLKIKKSKRNYYYDEWGGTPVRGISS